MTPFYTTYLPASTRTCFGCFPNKSEYLYRKTHGQMAFFPTDVTLQMCLKGNSVKISSHIFNLFISKYYLNVVKFINTLYISVQFNLI